MDSLLGKLGIDWKLFLAQLINFMILFFVLRKFLYKPILDMLEKRAQMISRGVAEAKKAEEDARDADEKCQKMLQDTQNKSKEIINEAKTDGEEERVVILEKAKKEKLGIIESGVLMATQEKEKMKEELQKETADFLVLALEKTVQRVMTEDEKKKIIEDSVDLLEFNK